MGQPKSININADGGVHDDYTSGGACCHPAGSNYRWTVLVFSCLLTFGSYYSFDMPSVLEDDLKKRLDIGDTEYSLFYALYGWTNMLLVIGGGLLVDVAGLRVSTYIFSSLIVIGQALFAFGVTAKTYWIAALGRLVFGMGGGNVTVSQNAITTKYFQGKELAMAFGITLAASRLGSIINFFVSAKIEERVSLPFVVWFGTMLCGLGCVCAFMFGVLDKRADRHGVKAAAVRKISLRDVKTFPLSFWVLSVVCALFYINVFAFVAIASDFFQSDKYSNHYSQSTAAEFAGIIYAVSLLFSPITGRIVDKVGNRGYLTILACGMTIPAFVLFKETDIRPYYIMPILGIAYTVAASTLWPSVPLLVLPRTIGTAMGFMTSVQMCGIALANVMVGEIKTKYSYDACMLFFCGAGVLGALAACLLNVIEGKRLNGRDTSAKREEDDEEAAPLMHPSRGTPGVQPYGTIAVDTY